MPKRNLTPAPIDFPAEFARLGRRAQRRLRELDEIAAEACDLRDRLLAMHPEVVPWSAEQDRLERLYGMAAVFDLLNVAGD